MDKRKDKARAADPAAPPPGDADGADADVGSRLRAMFEAVEAAPVPDEITRLVDELEKKRTRRRPRSH
jgi:hypothetical protein